MTLGGIPATNQRWSLSWSKKATVQNGPVCESQHQKHQQITKKKTPSKYHQIPTTRTLPQPSFMFLEVYRSFWVLRKNSFYPLFVFWRQTDQGTLATRRRFWAPKPGCPTNFPLLRAMVALEPLAQASAFEWVPLISYVVWWIWQMHFYTGFWSCDAPTVLVLSQ